MTIAERVKLEELSYHYSGGVGGFGKNVSTGHSAT
jgi:hypothetical protein